LIRSLILPGLLDVNFSLKNLFAAAKNWTTLLVHFLQKKKNKKKIKKISNIKKK